MVSILKYLILRDPNDRLLVYSLLILKKVLILYFIALIFMFFVSLFTKANEVKLIEGNAEWFKSPAQKQREAQQAQQRRELAIRDYNYCLTPTYFNYWDCGKVYFFPKGALTDGIKTGHHGLKRRMDKSKKPNKAVTTSLNNDLKQY